MKPVRVAAGTARNHHDPVALNMGPTAWMEDANCKGRDPEWWTTADHGRRAKLSNERWDQLEEQSKDNLKALALCSWCPVRTECLEWAYRHNLDHGIFGGLYPDERNALRCAS